ncbi:hypothetical protein PM082_010151 [Marasmius tenuissimus]|nr:hypothetical protein PM082_010151 [Marasmius tenuissimus]
MLQIYGHNQSDIPLLLLYDELVPAAHLKGNISRLGRMYLYNLNRQLGCEEEELWLDVGRGLFCRGPFGPAPNFYRNSLGLHDLPLSMEFIQGDVLLRFLASLKSKEVDRIMVMEAITSGTWITDVFEQVSRTTVISTTTKTPIAVAANIWESDSNSLSERRLLEDGMTRFKLAKGIYLGLRLNPDAENAWLPQASSILHARGISLENVSEVYELIHARAWLNGSLSNYQVRQDQESIYLFIRPPPPDLRNCATASLHYWSLQEDGQAPLSHLACHDLGLPVELYFYNHSSYSRSWSNECYETLHQYQLLRAFDPTTTGFARYLGYDIVFNPLNDSARFDQVHQESSPERIPSTLASDVQAIECPTQIHPTRIPLWICDCHF